MSANGWTSASWSPGSPPNAASRSRTPGATASGRPRTPAGRVDAAWRPRSTASAAPRAVAPSSAAPKAVPVVEEGVQAARQQGWKLVDRDEFTGALGTKWGEYDGEGHDGEGRRTPDAISVRGGVAVIRGDAEGDTGGMAWRDARETGRWEMRAKFPKGDAQYHPVLMLWPQDGGS